MAGMIDAGAARDALAKLPGGTIRSAPPTPEHVYLPRSHLKAMEPDRVVVTGMPGAGKTFWWNALRDGDIRRLIGQADERPPLDEHTEVRAGFGVRPAADEYPDQDTLRGLMNSHFEPKAVWRAIQAWHIAREERPPHPLRQQDSWGMRVKYAADHPEAIERLFQARDAELDSKGVYFLIVFDGLDRCTGDWTEAFRAIRGLLQTAGEMRSYRKLRAKVFLRSDQADDDGRIADSPDAWKALATKIDLSWPPHELYGLLWSCLANGPRGDVFRSFFWDGDWPSVMNGQRRMFLVPRRPIIDAEHQEKKFHGLAGRRMGRTPSYGIPYTWIRNRLSDAEGRVSPHSFLAALRAAAEHTADRRPEHSKALHPDGIRRGVHEASKLRVEEMEEGYPWMRPVMRSLAGMYVPCEFDEIAERWRSERVLDRLAEESERSERRLPPRHLADGPEGVRRDLEFLGVFQPLYDGRVYLPDVFRMGYGLGRRGGVKPVR